MEEQYTLEEWIGMLEEAGYSLEEGNAANKEKKKLALLARATPEDREKVADILRYRQADGGTVPSGFEDTKDRNQRKTKGAELTRAIRYREGRTGNDTLGPIKRPYRAWDLINNPDIRAVHDYMKRVSPTGEQPNEKAYNLTKKIVKGDIGKLHPTPNLPEAYTLEEWMSKLEEAGYSVEEAINVKSAVKKAVRKLGNAVLSATSGIARPQVEKQKIIDRISDPSISPEEKERLQVMLSGHPTNFSDLYMEEQYTLEELMSMIQEAGASDDERAEIVKRLNAAMAAKGGTGSMKAVVDAARELAAHRKQVKRTQPTSEGTSTNEEQYTLEEWMGMMEEAGYDVSEYRLWRPEEHGANTRSGVVRGPKKPKQPSEPRKPKSSRKPKPWETEEDWRGLHGLTPDEDPRPDLGENNKSTISENTVARLQGLAGIKPLNG